MATTGKNARERLATHIEKHGPVPTVQVVLVSRGERSEKPEVYWDVIRGLIVVYAGLPWHVLLDEPVPQFEVAREADDYANWIAQTEGRLSVFYGTRALLESECSDVLARLASLGKA